MLWQGEAVERLEVVVAAVGKNLVDLGAGEAVIDGNLDLVGTDPEGLLTAAGRLEQACSLGRGRIQAAQQTCPQAEQGDAQGAEAKISLLVLCGVTAHGVSSFVDGDAGLNAGLELFHRRGRAIRRSVLLSVSVRN